MWKKDENTIWRNKKWYDILMIVSPSILGDNHNDKIEIIDLHYDKDKVWNIIDNKYIYPGYHMNKRSWITIKLEGSLPNKKIYKLINKSYNLSGGVRK